LILMQGIAALVGLVLVPWSYMALIERKNPALLLKRESNWIVVIAATVLAVVTLAIAISPIVDWNANFEFPEWLDWLGRQARQSEDMAAELVKLFTSNMTPVSFVFLFLIVAVLPGVGEEFVFRGMIQTELYRAVRNPHVAIWLAAIMFSAIHFQFFGFVPRLIIGAFLGYLYYWSGNLWVPMIGHFFNNGIQLTGLYLYQKHLITFNPEGTERLPWPAVALAIVITIGLLLFLKNYFASESRRTTGGTA
jgi:membrane protease YdiL (CAAX protease family)